MTNVTIIPVYVPSYTETAPTYALSVGTSGIVGSGGVATGVDGVYTVVNSGRIGTSATDTGVLIVRGGTVINDLGATIAAGGIGVSIGSGYENRGTHTSFGSVANDGTILAGTGAGLYFGDNALQGAFVTNGGTGNTTALISGRDGILDLAGVFSSVDATIRNFGTIQGTGGVGYAGVNMDGTPGTIVNGSSLDSHALIAGYIGIDGSGDGDLVVQNFGTIEGTGGEAVLLGAPSDTLIVEAGATFIGAVDGAGGTLVLAGDAGAGTLTGLGTSFTSFNDVSVASGAAWTLTGVNSIAAGTVLTNNGTLSDAGTLVNDGTLLAPGQALQVAAGGSLINAGSIAGTAPGGIGVDLRGGGVIVNGASGSAAASILGGQYGIFAVNGPTTLTNFGTILASDGGSGFYQGSGVATIFNAGVIGATNGSGVGIDLADGGTIIDSGAVEGGNTAIRFGGAGSNLLVLEQGYEFFGLIQGSASASNTLELVGSVGAPVTEKYLQPGVGLVNFQTVEFGPGAGNYATLGIGNDAELPATIAGFVGVHDTIDLAAVSDTGNNAATSFNSLTDVLTITGDNGSVQLQLDNNESYTGIDWVAQNDGNGGTAIHAVNVVPPEISGTLAGQTTTDEATDQPFAGVTITDANPSPEAETLTITLTNDGVATDADGTLSGTGLSWTGTGTYTLVAGSAAAAAAELQALTFTPTAHQVAPGDTVTTGFTITVTDTAGGTSSDSITTVGVTAVDDPPVVTAGATTSFIGGGAPVVLDSGLTVTDPSGSTLLGATVSIGAGFVSGDMLSFTNNGSSEGNITGSYDISTGILTLTSAGGAMPAQWQAALESVTFSGGSTGTRTISWTVSDDINSSIAVTSFVDVTVPPQISGTAGGQNTPDEATIDPFSAVSITDQNSGQTETVTVTLSSAANGMLSDLGGGSYDSATGVYTVTGTDTAVSAAVDGLVFTPTAHQVAAGDTVTTTFTIAVTDTAGGTSSNSTTSVTATAVNDPPAITGTLAGQLISDDQTERPFSRVTITDPDAGAIETVTITLNVDGVAERRQWHPVRCWIDRDGPRYLHADRRHPCRGDRRACGPWCSPPRCSICRPAVRRSPI